MLLSEVVVDFVIIPCADKVWQYSAVCFIPCATLSSEDVVKKEEAHSVTSTSTQHVLCQQTRTGRAQTTLLLPISTVIIQTHSSSSSASDGSRWQWPLWTCREGGELRVLLPFVRPASSHSRPRDLHAQVRRCYPEVRTWHPFACGRVSRQDIE